MSQSSTGRIGVWGRSGSGKSSFLKALLAKRDRVIVFDLMDEYSKGLGMKRVTSVSSLHKEVANDFSKFRLAYVPRSGNEINHLRAVCKVIQQAQAPYRGESSGPVLTLAIEEMNTSFPVHGGAQKCPEFADLCSRGRHLWVELIGASQRIAEVDTRFRGNCTATVCFAQKGDRDQRAAALELGQDVARVRDLQNLEFLSEKNGDVKAGRIVFKRNKPQIAPR